MRVLSLRVLSSTVVKLDHKWGLVCPLLGLICFESHNPLLNQYNKITAARECKHINNNKKYK